MELVTHVRYSKNFEIVLLLCSLYPTDDDLLAAKIDGLLDEENDMMIALTISRYPWRFHK